jgi:hypothetical protein
MLLLNTPAETTESLRERLASFETLMGTPIVSGEQAAWLRASQAGLDELASLVREQFSQSHPKQFAAIRKEDGELSSQVQLLVKEDGAILKQLPELRAKADKLAQLADEVKPDEVKLADSVQKFIDSALAFVVRVRKQEQAITTWTMEAFNRDRGVGD